MGRPTPDDIDEIRLERALTLTAFLVVKHGPVLAPIFDRLERELLDLRARQRDPMDRARRYLMAHTIETPLKAIR